MKLFVAQGNNIIWQFVCSPGVQNTKYKILVLKSQLEMSKKSGFQGQKQWSPKFHIKFRNPGPPPPYLGNIPNKNQLFRSARTSCTTSDGPVRVFMCLQEKSGSHIYRHICLMNHKKTPQTNPMGPGDPLDGLLTPW